MKKIMFLLVAVFSLAIVTTSCKESKKETEKHEMHEEHHEADHKEGEDHKMAEAVFACPMDCEDGKTYAEAGSCPECKMDLKQKGGDKEMKHAEGCKCQEGGECKCADGECECKKEMKHAENCKCQADGECKCEEGKCECQKEMALAENDCKMCEPGACECKA